MSEKREDSRSISSPVPGIATELSPADSKLPSNLEDQALVLPNKRPNSEQICEYFTASENQPIDFPNKKQKLMPELEREEALTDGRLDIVNSPAKRTNMSGSNVPVPHNPLCERNIRIENDNCNGVKVNYENINASKVVDESDVNRTELCEATPMSPKQLINPLNSKNDNDNIVNNNENVNDNNVGGVHNGANIAVPQASLSSTISSLDSQHNPSSSTLDYVARLPDGCPRQTVEGLEDVSATPPHYPHHPTPLHEPSYSGDEDDDNYLDSSDEDGEGGEGVGNLDEDESCGEGKLILLLN